MKRATPLTRHTALRAQTPLKAAAATRKPPRDTGPSRAIRLAVYERDSWSCVSCGRPVRDVPHSLQHRKARGRGGSSDPAINSPCNLLTMCGSGVTGCHGRVESRADPADRVNGYQLASWQDPAAEPVTLHSDLTVWLREDGTYAGEPPERGAA